MGKTPTKLMNEAHMTCSVFIIMHYSTVLVLMEQKWTLFPNKFHQTIHLIQLVLKGSAFGTEGKKNKIGRSSSKSQNAVNCYFKACSNNYGDKTLKGQRV